MSAVLSAERESPAVTAPGRRLARWTPRTGASLLVYSVLLFFSLIEQPGRTTTDTKLFLIQHPADLMRQAFTLWSNSHNFGEVQNQAYGYLFPQAPFFWLSQMAHMEPWLAERLWATLLLVVGCEGGRLLARAIGLGPWPAWIAGMAYGLNARVIGQVAVRSAEIVPTAVLPWVALPLVLAIAGRLPARRAALFSAAAFTFGGAVNATGTVAVLPLLLVVILWGILTHRVGWSLLGWWSGFMVVANAWWVVALLRLSLVSPPFFDFVEDARTTTQTTGFQAALRGTSNWVGYTFLSSSPNWPAGAQLAYEPVLVMTTGALAVLGLMGLVLFASPWRTPLLVSAVIGMVLVTVAHVVPLTGSPIDAWVRDLLDGPLAPLRNISKADPNLRLPLSVGLGALAMRIPRLAGGPSRRRPGRSRLANLTRYRTPAAWAVLVVLVLSTTAPILAQDTRPAGWRAVPSYWTQAAHYLAKASGQRRAWLVPGSGFALQSWGWTFDEPFESVASTPWVSRSQVALTPPETIRSLSVLEAYLDTGAGSPNLGASLGRLGIGYILVRHDLDTSVVDSPDANDVGLALARSRGIDRVATFGSEGFGPAIEIYRVTADIQPDVTVHPLDDVVTVAGASSDVIQAVGNGTISSDQPALVQGDDGWEKPADVVGDTYRLRERNFGRVHDAEGPVLATNEPRHSGRRISNYPANQASRPVVAQYASDTVVTASSSQAWTDTLGPVRPEDAPYSAVDGDDETGWVSSVFRDARKQWWEMKFQRPRAPGLLQVRSPVGDPSYADVARWRVTVGKRSVLVPVNPFTGIARIDLGDASSSRWRIAVDKVRGSAEVPISITEVSAASLPVSRALVLPRTRLSSKPTLLFSAQPETRSCVATLLGPDCSPVRGRSSDESQGISRMLDLPASGRYSLDGTVIARAQRATAQLMYPLDRTVVMSASSVYFNDPSVSVRMAYDGSGSTSWIADPRDEDPTVVVSFDRPRTIDRLLVTAPSSPAVVPTRAVITAAGGTRKVALGEFSRFAPLTGTRFTIHLRNSTRKDAPLGLGELEMPGVRLARPAVGGERTGAVCGLGPRLVVNGISYPTRVDGLLGDVVSAGPLQVRSCSEPIALRQGHNQIRLISTGQFQPVAARLRPEGVAPQTPSQDARRVLGPRAISGTSFDVRLSAGAESLLATHLNANPGWTAELGGHRLPPLKADGWAQGWRIPSGDAGVVKIRYAPQRPYVVGLAIGLAGAGLLVLWAAALLFTTRLFPAHNESPAEASARGVGKRGRTVTVVAAPVSLLLGGVPALVAWAAGLVLARRSLLIMAAVLLATAVMLTSVHLISGPRISFPIADLLAGLGFFVAVASCWSRDR
jgi:arabinofuranan 3-O-arabinosyltransferase